MSPSPPARGSGRRRFLQTVALTALSSAVAGPVALAQSAKKRPAARKPAPRPEPVRPADPAAPPISDEARALAQIVQRRYGAHLTADQLSAVTRELENRVQGGQRLRAVPLGNGDEPDTTFRA